MTTRAALSRTEARWAIEQSSVVEILGVLAYAEGFAIVAAGVGVTTGEPERLVRRIVDETLQGALRWMPSAHTFPTHLRRAARLEIAGQLALHARLRGHVPKPWDARLAPVQVGDLRGVEQLAHFAGEMMPTVRSNDGTSIETAIKLTDFVRARLSVFAGEPDDEDTAKLTVPAALVDNPEPKEDQN